MQSVIIYQVIPIAQVSPRGGAASGLFFKLPPEQPTILDQWGRIVNGTAGPYEEGDTPSLTCRVTGVRYNVKLILDVKFGDTSLVPSYLQNIIYSFEKMMVRIMLAKTLKIQNSRCTDSILHGTTGVVRAEEMTVGKDKGEYSQRNNSQFGEESGKRDNLFLQCFTTIAESVTPFGRLITFGSKARLGEVKLLLNSSRKSKRDTFPGSVLYGSLICSAGKPEPMVRWLVNGQVKDEEYEKNAGDVIENSSYIILHCENEIWSKLIKELFLERKEHASDSAGSARCTWISRINSRSVKNVYPKYIASSDK
ncbi:hypothetical protein WN51_08632 [Melipona quadrifasciata]|uniref:Ig-like domain-containing protein n=1 Tax=Melipona quadrifasciata TaxID=166423 RepID=A0A0M9A9T4_9HYME|nr:hypothetical protein WN51_08632 [Melipona quadrifasciata]